MMRINEFEQSNSAKMMHGKMPCTNHLFNQSHDFAQQPISKFCKKKCHLSELNRLPLHY